MVDTAVRDANDQERLTQLGYRQELRRVLSLFDNFSVAFAYLSPSSASTRCSCSAREQGDPPTSGRSPFVVIFMLFVALVFGELGSHYPVSGALYQYGKYSVALHTDGGLGGSTGSRSWPPSPASTRVSSPT